MQRKIKTCKASCEGCNFKNCTKEEVPGLCVCGVQCFDGCIETDNACIDWDGIKCSFALGKK